MKIAFAWMDLADATDCTLVETLGREIQKLGHSLLAVGPRRHPGEPFRGFKDQVVVYRVGFYFLRWFPWLNDTLAFFQLLWIHSRERIDVWHFRVLGRNFRALRWAALYGKWPFLLTIQFPMKDFLPLLGNARRLKNLASRAYHVTTLSQSGLSEILQLLPELKNRVSVVPNGAELAYNPEQEIAAAKLQIPKPYFLSVARLSRYKGLDLLVMAFAKLLDEGYDAHLVICGQGYLDGGLTQFIQRLGLEKRIRLVGQVSRLQVTELLEECFSFVLASREEPFALALLEAMAAGKPIVATQVGGTPEIVRDRIDGILVPPNNVDALANGLGCLLQDPTLRDQLGQSARKRAQEFNWSRVAMDYVNLYHKGSDLE